MKLSYETEYACLALIYLSRNYNDNWIRIEDIAAEENIPKKFLERILLTLKKAGYLKSRQGVNGGYMLMKPPQDIKLVDIIRLLNGPIAPTKSVSVYFYENTPIEKNEKLHILFKDIRNYINEKLENTTFADLI